MPRTVAPRVMILIFDRLLPVLFKTLLYNEAELKPHMTVLPPSVFFTVFNKCLFQQSFPFWLLRAGFALGPPARRGRGREWMGQLPLKS